MKLSPSVLAFMIVLIFIQVALPAQDATYTCCKSFANNGTTIDTFENISVWTAGGNGSIFNDTTHFSEGTQGVRLSGHDSNNYMERNLYINMLGAKNIGFDVFIDNASNLSSAMDIYLSNTTGYTVTYISYYTPYMGWNRIALDLRDTEITTNKGSDSFETNLRVKMRIKFNALSGKTLNATFDNLVYNISGQPNIIFSFDDAYRNVITNAKPIMDTNNQAGQVFMTTNNINYPDYLTTQNLLDMQNDSWAIGVHTVTHPDLTKLSDSKIRAELRNSQVTLRNIGISNISTSVFAYPYGTYNDNVINIVKENYTMSRSADTFIFNKHPVNDSMNSIYKVRIKSVHSTTSEATVKKWINNNINQSGLIILLFHDIVNKSSPAVGEWNTTSFINISNYVASRSSEIHTVTMNDYLIENPSIPPSPTIALINYLRLISHIYAWYGNSYISRS